jgi:GrpB-like predicted nucleotidyltransferase (UPF0157 family)
MSGPRRRLCPNDLLKSYMPTPLVITEYDPQWPVLFEELRVKFSELLGDMASAIEHVGSTSVPGLAAKPIIDLDVLLASAACLPETIRRLATLGYEHQGDLGIAGREAFQTPPDLFARDLALMTKVRTFIHEEISLLTVLYFPFRARTPY